MPPWERWLWLHDAFEANSFRPIRELTHSDARALRLCVGSELNTYHKLNGVSGGSLGSRM